MIVERASSSSGRAARRRGSPTAVIGGALVALAVLTALAAPLIAPFDPHAQDLERRLEPPSLAHPMGFDELGRDVLSRLIWGARVSLAVGVAVVLAAGALGTAIGALAGLAGGVIDSIAMRLCDVLLAFPGILLAIALVAVLGPALEHLIVALVVIGWVGYARLVRGEVMRLKGEEFVTAARAAGASAGTIVMRHLLPNVLPVLAVQASLGLAGAILAEAGLSFLGLGVEPPVASWGAMINAGRSHLLDAPHVSLFPGLAILATTMGSNFLGDGLVDLLAPRAARRE